MDPDANLKEQRQLVETIRKDIDDGKRPDVSDVDRLLDLVDALDNWMCRGGFMPYPWRALR